MYISIFNLIQYFCFRQHHIFNFHHIVFKLSIFRAICHFNSQISEYHKPFCGWEYFILECNHISTNMFINCIVKLTKPVGPCKVISGTPTSWIVKAVPGKPPMFFHTDCVINMCSSLANLVLCSCASRWVPSPQLNRYLSNFT